MPTASTSQGLTIGELARRTGLGAQTLRAWETRHGFPVPLRTESGHRRFATADVEAVQRVLALKESGMRLEQAIARAVSDTEDPSVFGALRQHHPELPVQRLRRRTLVQLSRAIEDEAYARAGRAVVLGAFQRGDFFGHQAGRWGELARTAATCAVFADFGSEPELPDLFALPGLHLVGLPADSPLLREWAVVVLAPRLNVVLTGWEVPGTPGEGGERVFESLFSVDPAAVRTAARTLVACAGSVGVDLGVDVDRFTATPTPGATDALVLRAFGYLDQQPIPASEIEQRTP